MCLAASVLVYLLSLLFKEKTDPRVKEIYGKLPQLNCGACGLGSCQQFAEKLLTPAEEEDEKEEMHCQHADPEVLDSLLNDGYGINVKKQKQIAVVRCNGSCLNAPPKVKFYNINKCIYAHKLGSGENFCPSGCLHLGDCVTVCRYGAIEISKTTGLPVVNEKCTACGDCVDACPRKIIELRDCGVRNRRIYVACINHERNKREIIKNCKTACINCDKCIESCEFFAITKKNNYAYIDFEKCVLCRKCVLVCPNSSILMINFNNNKEKENN